MSEQPQEVYSEFSKKFRDIHELEQYLHDASSVYEKQLTVLENQLTSLGTLPNTPGIQHTFDTILQYTREAFSAISALQQHANELEQERGKLMMLEQRVNALLVSPARERNV